MYTFNLQEYANAIVRMPFISVNDKICSLLLIYFLFDEISAILGSHRCTLSIKCRSVGPLIWRNMVHLFFIIYFLCTDVITFFYSNKLLL